MKKSLIALAFGTLALGMSEFVMMGILPDIARSLGVSIPEAGHLISAYALGVCFGAPLMVLVARKRLLKQILLALTAMIAAVKMVGNLKFISLLRNSNPYGDDYNASALRWLPITGRCWACVSFRDFPTAHSSVWGRSLPSGSPTPGSVRKPCRS